MVSFELALDQPVNHVRQKQKDQNEFALGWKKFVLPQLFLPFCQISLSKKKKIFKLCTRTNCTLWKQKAILRSFNLAVDWREHSTDWNEVTGEHRPRTVTLLVRSQLTERHALIQWSHHGRRLHRVIETTVQKGDIDCLPSMIPHFINMHKAVTSGCTDYGHVSHLNSSGQDPRS